MGAYALLFGDTFPCTYPNPISFKLPALLKIRLSGEILPCINPISCRCIRSSKTGFNKTCILSTGNLFLFCVRYVSRLIPSTYSIIVYTVPFSSSNSYACATACNPAFASSICAFALYFCFSCSYLSVP